MNFIRVGKRAYNLDLVTQAIWSDQGILTLYLGNSTPDRYAEANATPKMGTIRIEGIEARALIKYFEELEDLLNLQGVEPISPEIVRPL